MQRSRRALLKRRAAAAAENNQKNHSLGRMQLYKVSLSLVFLTWAVVFLLNSLVSHGNGYRDGLDSLDGESIWHESSFLLDKGSAPIDISGPLGPSSNIDAHNTTPFSDVETVEHKPEVSSSDSDRKENPMALESVKLVEEMPNVDTKVEVEKKNNAAEVTVKSERVSRVAPPGLDEFKSKAIAINGKPNSGVVGIVVHRVEPGGREYNYASGSKGAKVLEFNKEAKGASNILDKDKDKYLRNPCSAEEKFVVIELSEETLVDAMEIANFEHYSSNLKDFEVLSSLVYPTDSWEKLGNFTAGNVKHAQRFAFPEPKWARYLKLNLLSHYGSEFYCTLSAVEVYGVDAVERMLEDLILHQNKQVDVEQQSPKLKQMQEPVDDVVSFHQESTKAVNSDLSQENSKAKHEMPVKGVSDPVGEARQYQVGRMPGDTVLKILMQKVQALDVNFAVLERYLEELNTRYGRIFNELDGDIAGKEALLEKLKLEIHNLHHTKDALAKDIDELLSWRVDVSLQLHRLVEDNAFIRSELERVTRRQDDTEKKSLAVIFVSFIFGCIASSRLIVGLVSLVCRTHYSEKFCMTSSAWLVLLLSSCIIAFISILWRCV